MPRLLFAAFSSLLIIPCCDVQRSTREQRPPEQNAGVCLGIAPDVRELCKKISANLEPRLEIVEGVGRSCPKGWRCFAPVKGSFLVVNREKRNVLVELFIADYDWVGLPVEVDTRYWKNSIVGESQAGRIVMVGHEGCGTVPEGLSRVLGLRRGRCDTPVEDGKVMPRIGCPRDVFRSGEEIDRLLSDAFPGMDQDDRIAAAQVCYAFGLACRRLYVEAISSSGNDTFGISLDALASMDFEAAFPIIARHVRGDESGEATLAAKWTADNHLNERLAEDALALLKERPNDATAVDYALRMINRFEYRKAGETLIRLAQEKTFKDRLWSLVESLGLIGYNEALPWIEKIEAGNDLERTILENARNRLSKEWMETKSKDRFRIEAKPVVCQGEDRIEVMVKYDIRSFCFIPPLVSEVFLVDGRMYFFKSRIGGWDGAFPAWSIIDLPAELPCSVLGNKGRHRIRVILDGVESNTVEVEN